MEDLLLMRFKLVRRLKLMEDIDFGDDKHGLFIESLTAFRSLLVFSQLKAGHTLKVKVTVKIDANDHCCIQKVLNVNDPSKLLLLLLCDACFVSF